MFTSYNILVINDKQYQIKYLDLKKGFQVWLNIKHIKKTWMYFFILCESSSFNGWSIVDIYLYIFKSRIEGDKLFVWESRNRVIYKLWDYQDWIFILLSLEKILSSDNLEFSILPRLFSIL